MRIANPLYDHAFKFLMSNNRLAKKVISTILDTRILKLELNQQEFVSEGKIRGTRVFRLDFKATILQENGNKRQVMVELQKSKLPTNIYRFRQYLGSLYADKSRPEDFDFEDRKAPETLPIIAIYILGYNIDDLPTLATRISANIANAVSGEIFDSDSEFVQTLSHESYILQIGRLPENRRTRLEKFLNLFNQAYVSDKNYILNLDDIPTEFKDIAEYLQKPLKMEKMVEQFTVEEEMEMYFRIVEAEKKKLASEIDELTKEKEEIFQEKEILSREKEELFREKEEIFNEKEKLSDEKEKLSNEKEKLSNEKVRLSNEKERISNEKEELSKEKTEIVQELKLTVSSAEKAEQEAKVANLKLAKLLLSLGRTIDEVEKETNLSNEEVMGLNDQMPSGT